MLVFGTANPEGISNSAYKGVYLTEQDLQNLLPDINGVGVKVEHKGPDIGKVVSSWIHNGRLDVVMEIDEKILQGAFAKSFIENGLCKELSLGYSAEMQCSKAEGLVVKKKKVLEVSVVKKGARHNCQIHAWSK